MIKKSPKITAQPLYLGAGLCLLVVLIIYAYSQYQRYYPNTNDAYVSAPLIQVAAKVKGYVKAVHVTNNQRVKKGELLLEIESTDYDNLLKQAVLSHQIAKQESLAAKQQIVTANTNILKAKANVLFTAQMLKRYTALYQDHAGAKQTMQKYQNDHVQAIQDLNAAEVLLKQATVQSAMANSKIQLTSLQVKHAKEMAACTHLYSPINGYVSQMHLQSGQLIGVGERLFGLVDDNSWWVDADFKETQLNRIKKNQTVSIDLDMYDHHYQGTVQSISYVSNNTFSLLPAQNASGNWVKVSQRFTVRITLQNNQTYPLRVGSSANVTVHTLDHV